MIDKIFERKCYSDVINAARKKTLVMLSIASTVSMTDLSDNQIVPAVAVLNTVAVSSRRLNPEKPNETIDEEALNELTGIAKECIKSSNDEECLERLKVLKEKLKNEVIELLSDCDESETWSELVEKYVELIEEETVNTSRLGILTSALSNVAAMLGKPNARPEELVNYAKRKGNKELERAVEELVSKYKEEVKRAKQIRKEKEELEKKFNSLAP